MMKKGAVVPVRLKQRTGRMDAYFLSGVDGAHGRFWRFSFHVKVRGFWREKINLFLKHSAVDLIGLEIWNISDIS